MDKYVQPPPMIHPDVITKEELEYLRQPEVKQQAMNNTQRLVALERKSYQEFLERQGISDIPPEILEAEKRGEKRGWKKAVIEFFMEGTIGIDILKKKLGIQTNEEAMIEIKKVSPNFHFPATS